MSTFDDLKIKNGEVLTSGKWNNLVEHLEKTELKIPTNENGEIIGGVSVGVVKDKVGIGTSAPQRPLHIKADGGIINIEGSTHSYLQLYYNGINKGRSAWIGNGSPNLSNNHLSIMNETNGGLFLGTNKKNHLYINPQGLVGVGSSSPTEKLQINGNLRVMGKIRFSNNSVQDRASEAIIVRSGTIKMNTTGDWKKSPLGKGKKATHISAGVRLTGFTTKPQIFYSIVLLDSDKGRNARISISPGYISKTGFRMKFHTWGDSKVYQCIANWMAIGK